MPSPRPNDLKIAYLGGGSREWARKLMIDLAVCPDLNGTVALYDIDIESARLNEELGNWLQGKEGVVSHWNAWLVKSPSLRSTGFISRLATPLEPQAWCAGCALPPFMKALLTR